MEFEYYIEAEDSTEKELIDRIADARDTALDEGMSQNAIETVLLVFAMRMGSEQGSNEKSPTASVCPSCGEPVNDIESRGIGEDVVCIPCGCSVSMDRLPDVLLQDVFAR